MTDNFDYTTQNNRTHNVEADNHGFTLGDDLIHSTIYSSTGVIHENQALQALPLEASDAIGVVETAEGAVSVLGANGETRTLNVGDPVFQGDLLQTGDDASVGLTFVDDSTFSLDENGEITLDELVYDPDTGTGQFSTSITSGVFSFVSGQIAKVSPDAMTITTPVATIGIRGTQGVLKFGDDGLEAALLQEPNGLTGEMVITNASGSTVLNQPNQFTTVISFTSTPGQPVVIESIQVFTAFGTRTINVVNEARASAAQRRAEQAQEEAEALETQALEAAAAAEAAEGEEAETLREEAEALAEAAAEAAAEAEALLQESEILQAEQLAFASQIEALEQQILQITAQANSTDPENQDQPPEDQDGNFDFGDDDIEVQTNEAENDEIIEEVIDILTILGEDEFADTLGGEPDTLPDDPEEDPETPEEPLDNGSSSSSRTLDIIYTSEFTSGFDDFSSEESTNANEGIAALAGDDTISAYAGDDIVIGGSGNDEILGEMGNDLIHGDVAANSGDFSLVYDALDAAGVMYETDTTLSGNDDLDGGQGDDTIFGGYGSDTLRDGSGSDSLVGGEGSDTFITDNDNQSDILEGGNGTDSLNVSGFDSSVELTISGANSGTVSDGTSDSFSSIEKFELTNSADTIRIEAGAESDEIRGQDGDDNFILSPNSSSISYTLYGDSGNDSFGFSDEATNAQNVEVNGGTGLDSFTITDTGILSQVTLSGGGDNDTLKIDNDSAGTFDFTNTASYSFSGIDIFDISGQSSVNNVFFIGNAMISNFTDSSTLTIDGNNGDQVFLNNESNRMSLGQVGSYQVYSYDAGNVRVHEDISVVELN